jgi:hypothetical protein
MEIENSPISHPRKRKAFEETVGENSLNMDRQLVTPKRIRWNLVKELEQSESSASFSSPPRPAVVAQQQLGDLLQGVDKEELIRIITTLTSQDPSLEEKVALLLPRPTLTLTLGILEGLEKKLLESIPYSRLGPDRSDYSFNRIRGQMDELRGSLLQYLDFFTLPISYPSSLDHEYPGESFSYLHATTALVHRLPIWSNEERNSELKDPLYERLGRHWRITVTEVSRRVNHIGSSSFPNCRQSVWRSSSGRMGS